MGTITLTIVGDGSVGTKTKDYNVSDAAINRLVAVWQQRAATPQNPTPTVGQACLAWANRVMDVTRSDVLQSERQNAGDAVAPIDVS